MNETPSERIQRLHFASCVECVRHPPFSSIQRQRLPSAVVLKHIHPLTHTLQLILLLTVERADCARELFDDYADDFEDCLCKGLKYCIPEELLASLITNASSPTALLSTTIAVDLGCGTGLAGRMLKDRCSGRLLGCDLSSGMLAVAAEKGGYDMLEHLDCNAFLHKYCAESSADLIFAGDVRASQHSNKARHSYCACSRAPVCTFWLPD